MSRFAVHPTLLLSIGGTLLVFATLAGCRQPPMTNTVVSQAQSPDGRSTALLVDRYLQAARVADGFFLIVIPAGQDAKEAVNARNIGDTAVLVATSAEKVHLRWRDANTLLVICDSCGLNPINIAKKLGQAGATRIIYQGFPEHTAYS